MESTFEQASIARWKESKLPQQQGRQCRWCGLHFQDDDSIEIDYGIPRRQCGGEELSNTIALHRHCHDERHDTRVVGTSDQCQITEEPCDGKLPRTVAFAERSGDPFVWVNLKEYKSFAGAWAKLEEFIEQVHHTKRLHSTLGYVPRAEFEPTYAALPGK